MHREQAGERWQAIDEDGAASALAGRAVVAHAADTEFRAQQIDQALQARNLGLASYTVQVEGDSQDCTSTGRPRLSQASAIDSGVTGSSEIVIPEASAIAATRAAATAIPGKRGMGSWAFASV